MRNNGVMKITEIYKKLLFEMGKFNEIVDKFC